MFYFTAELMYGTRGILRSSILEYPVQFFRRMCDHKMKICRGVKISDENVDRMWLSPTYEKQKLNIVLMRPNLVLSALSKKTKHSLQSKE